MLFSSLCINNFFSNSPLFLKKAFSDEFLSRATHLRSKNPIIQKKRKRLPMPIQQIDEENAKDGRARRTVGCHFSLYAVCLFGKKGKYSPKIVFMFLILLLKLKLIENIKKN